VFLQNLDIEKKKKKKDKRKNNPKNFEILTEMKQTKIAKLTMLLG